MKKTILATLAVILLVGACTIVSYRNYVSGLNRVVVSDTVPNQLRSSYTVDGLLQFERIYETNVPMGASVEEIYVSEGEDFAVEAELLKVSEESLRVLLYENLAAQEALPTGKRGAVGELARLQKKKLQEQAEQLENLIEVNGVVSANCQGQVVEIPFEEGDVISKAVSYGCPEEGYRFTWEMPPGAYKKYTSAEISLDSGTVKISDMGAVQVQYEPNRGVYCFEVFVQEITNKVRISGGYHGTVTMEYISEEYGAVLPKNALQWEAGASYVYVLQQRETAYGLESYLRKTGVTVLESDEQHVAVISALEDVVVGSVRTPRDLEAVLVIK